MICRGLFAKVIAQLQRLIKRKSIFLVLDFFICYNGDKFGGWKQGNTMETKYYVVARIDEGTNLKYDFLQYEII